MDFHSGGRSDRARRTIVLLDNPRCSASPDVYGLIDMHLPDFPNTARFLTEEESESTRRTL